MNRDQLLDRAIRERRISAAQRDEFARMYDAQPAVVENLLTAGIGEGGLMPGLAATHEAVRPDTTAYDESFLNDRERAVLATRRGQEPQPPAVPAVPARSVSKKRRQPPQASATPEPQPYAPGSPYATGPAVKHPSPPPVAMPEADNDDAYDDSWLSASERSRRDAIRAGTHRPGPIQFEDDAARAAAGTRGVR